MDLLSEPRDKAAAKFLLNRREQSYYDQSEARICQENFEEKETLENTKPKDPETEDILTESNTKIWKKTLAGQNYIEYCGKSISNRCPIFENICGEFNVILVFFLRAEIFLAGWQGSARI